jgi:hypothetical protein
VTAAVGDDLLTKPTAQNPIEIGNNPMGRGMVDDLENINFLDD